MPSLSKEVHLPKQRGPIPQGGKGEGLLAQESQTASLPGPDPLRLWIGRPGVGDIIRAVNDGQTQKGKGEGVLPSPANPRDALGCHRLRQSLGLPGSWLWSRVGRVLQNSGPGIPAPPFLLLLLWEGEASGGRGRKGKQLDGQLQPLLSVSVEAPVPGTQGTPGQLRQTRRAQSGILECGKSVLDPHDPHPFPEK